MSLSAPDIRAARIGAEGVPVVIVDGFAPDCAALRVAASAASFGPAAAHYPGIRAPLPAEYLASVRGAIATIFAEAFGLARSARVLDASFSMVTRPAAKLSLGQRIPHVDAHDPGRIAMVHFLCDADQGGTAFFRHRATGFETIGHDRSAHYWAVLSHELRSELSAPAYIRDTTALFERTALIEPRANRALFYPSMLLHSGAIAADATLSADPAVGRLTITAFFDAD